MSIPTFCLFDPQLKKIIDNILAEVIVRVAMDIDDLQQAK